MSRSYPVVPVDWGTAKEHFRLLAETINQLLSGKTNTVNTFTLAASVGTTTVSHALAHSSSHVSYTATTANAATELATMYVSAYGDKQFVITHANNAQTDRTFTYNLSG